MLLLKEVSFGFTKYLLKNTSDKLFFHVLLTGNLFELTTKMPQRSHNTSSFSFITVFSSLHYAPINNTKYLPHGAFYLLLWYAGWNKNRFYFLQNRSSGCNNTGIIVSYQHLRYQNQGDTRWHVIQSEILIKDRRNGRWVSLLRLFEIG